MSSEIIRFGMREYNRTHGRWFIRTPHLLSGCDDTCDHAPLTHKAFITAEDAETYMRENNLKQPHIPFLGTPDLSGHYFLAYEISTGEGCAHALMKKLLREDTWEWAGPQDPWDLRDKLDALDMRRVHPHVRDLAARLKNLCAYAAQVGLDVHWR